MGREYRVSEVQHLSRDGPGEEEMICDGSELDRLISQYVNGKKAERNRAILREYYLHGYTFEEIAERFDMSAVQVGRVVRRDGDRILLMLKK